SPKSRARAPGHESGGTAPGPTRGAGAAPAPDTGAAPLPLDERQPGDASPADGLLPAAGPHSRLGGRIEAPGADPPPARAGQPTAPRRAGTPQPAAAARGRPTLDSSPAAV